MVEAVAAGIWNASVCQLPSARPVSWTSPRETLLIPSDGLFTNIWASPYEDGFAWLVGNWMSSRTIEPTPPIELMAALLSRGVALGRHFEGAGPLGAARVEADNRRGRRRIEGPVSHRLEPQHVRRPARLRAGPGRAAAHRRRLAARRGAAGRPRRREGIRRARCRRSRAGLGYVAQALGRAADRPGRRQTVGWADRRGAAAGLR